MTLQDAPATNHHAPGTHHFVPVAEAVRILGLSATTIRRKIDAGELEAERVARPQGTAFLVKVPADAPVDEPPRAADAPATPQHAPGTPQEAPDTRQDAPAGAEGIAAVVVPLVAQIDALRLTVERQADQLVAQAETIGALRAELGTAQARISELEAPRAAQAPVEASGVPEPLHLAPGAPMPSWTPRMVLAVALVAIVVAGAALLLR